MGGRSQPFPSLEWVGADCERNVWKNGSQGLGPGPFQGFNWEASHDSRESSRAKSDVPAHWRRDPALMRRV
jgi:hypothetical protein